MIKDFSFIVNLDNNGVGFFESPLIKGFLEHVFILFPADDAMSHRVILSLKGKGVNIINQVVYNLAHNLIAPRLQPCDGVGRDFTFSTTKWALNDVLVFQMSGVPNSSCRVIVRCS